MENCMFVAFTTIKQNKETLGPDHWGPGGPQKQSFVVLIMRAQAYSKKEKRR